MPTPYKKYLNSSHWKQFRINALAYYGTCCTVCSNRTRKLHVHHLNYDSLGNESFDDVTILCSKCHQDEHDLHLILFRTQSRFTKSFHDKTPNFPKDSFYRYWYFLVRQLEYQSNQLINNDGIPMSRDDIISLLKIGKSSFYNFMSYCKDHNYIHEVKVNDEQAFYMNPVYELNGSGITVELYLIFQGTCIERYVSKESKAMIKDYLGLETSNEPKTIS